MYFMIDFETKNNNPNEEEINYYHDEYERLANINSANIKKYLEEMYGIESPVCGGYCFFNKQDGSLKIIDPYAITSFINLCGISFVGFHLEKEEYDEFKLLKYYLDFIVDGAYVKVMFGEIMEHIRSASGLKEMYSKSQDDGFNDLDKEKFEIRISNNQINILVEKIWTRVQEVKPK